MRAVVIVAIAACWTSSTPTVKDEPKRPAPSSAAKPSHRATVRIDAKPSAKRFQGVWLELDDKKWLIDYRARELWTWFKDREVLVTGTCYAPVGQAIDATHFKVEHMSGATPMRGSQPYLEIGPEVMMRGELVNQTAPPGSKLAGATSLVFRGEDGVTYGLVGDPRSTVGPARVRARVLVPDMTYAARSGDLDLWIVDVFDPDYEEDATHAPPVVPCP